MNNIDINDSKKEEKLFKDGYVFQVETIDFDSPEIQKEITDCHKAQRECLERKIVDNESLEKRMGI